MPSEAPGLKVKICGLTRRKDAEMAAARGASYIGAVLVESSPRCIDPAAARALALGLAPELVIVVADGKPLDVAESARAAGASVVQLHGSESPEMVQEVAASGPWDVWKAVRVREPEELPRLLKRYAYVADGILLDGWDDEQLGGSGQSFDWSTAGPYLFGVRDQVTLILAGGLTSENVGRAVALISPDVVDVSSGVEREPGIKDPMKIHAFMSAAHT